MEEPLSTVELAEYAARYGTALRESQESPPTQKNKTSKFAYLGRRAGQVLATIHADKAYIRKLEEALKVAEENLLCVRPTQGVMDDHFYLKQWVQEASDECAKALLKIKELRDGE